MKPAGVHHVAICVADARKGLVFYRDALGMTQLPRPDLGPGCWLDAGGQQVHLMQSDTPPPGANHFAIRVDDIVAAVTDLLERGIEVHRHPLHAVADILAWSTWRRRRQARARACHYHKQDQQQ